LLEYRAPQTWLVLIGRIAGGCEPGMARHGDIS
jgi:hypothetical protein